MSFNRDAYQRDHETLEELRYEPEADNVLCESCGEVAARRDAESIPGGFVCEKCFDEERTRTCEGCGKRLPESKLKETNDGWLCEPCLYGYKRVEELCK